MPFTEEFSFTVAHNIARDCSVATTMLAVPPRPQNWGPLGAVYTRGRGAYLRTVENPVWSRIFVLCVALHTLVLVGINVAVGLLESDCHFTLLLSLASMTTLFMSYFALEAVRTENVYQCASTVHLLPSFRLLSLAQEYCVTQHLAFVPFARLVAYGLTSLAFVIGFLPPLLGSEHRTADPSADPSRAQRVRTLVLLSVVFACAMHVYAPRARATR